jgi:hypothetical protein
MDGDGDMGAPGPPCPGRAVDAFSAKSEFGKAPPCGNGRFFLEIHTIKCMAMANSSLSKRLSTGRSTIFQISRSLFVSTPDLENSATASCPYINPSGLAYCGKSASYLALSCGVMT